MLPCGVPWEASRVLVSDFDAYALGEVFDFDGVVAEAAGVFHVWLLFNDDGLEQFSGRSVA